VSSSLIFEVATCGVCNADACASTYENICSSSSASLVRANCVERRAWFVRLVPILFIASALVLVVCGFLFQHRPPPQTPYNTLRDPLPPPALSRPTLKTVESASFGDPRGPVQPPKRDRPRVPAPLVPEAGTPLLAADRGAAGHTGDLAEYHGVPRLPVPQAGAALVRPAAGGGAGYGVAGAPPGLTSPLAENLPVCPPWPPEIKQ
jgi:hypothetical protein